MAVVKLSSRLKTLKSNFTLIRHAIQDTLRYRRHAVGFSLSDACNAEHLLAIIAVHAHVLERGLALPSPRVGFAKGEIAAFDKTVSRYFAAGHSESACELYAALGALRAYRAWHDGKFDLGVTGELVDNMIRMMLSNGVPFEDGGVMVVERDILLAGGRASFEEFAKSRHSVRTYSQEPVDEKIILQAVNLAQTAPSVCNRQSGRVHLYLDSDRVKDVVDCHIGSGGFKDAIPGVAIVTSELQSFHGSKERYQAWVDGGLILMQFLNGLHAVGLAGCPLNWSVNPDRDELLRLKAGIPDCERIIALVSFGYLLNRVQFARSARISTNKVAKIHR